MDNLKLMKEKQRLVLESIDETTSNSDYLAAYLDALNVLSNSISAAEKAQAEVARVEVEERKSRRQFQMKAMETGGKLVGDVAMLVGGAYVVNVVADLTKNGYIISKDLFPFVGKCLAKIGR